MEVNAEETSALTLYGFVPVRNFLKAKPLETHMGEKSLIIPCPADKRNFIAVFRRWAAEWRFLYMAFFNCYYKSAVLGQDVCFNAVIPEDCADNIKTVYLLHGLSDNHTAWERRSSVERYAQNSHVALIMPNVDRSFYTDMKFGRNFYTFVTQELVDYTRKVFRLSKKRDDTFVAGLSMGGYGAFKIALRESETFSAAASLSGVLDISSHAKPTGDRKSDAYLAFGEGDTLEGTDESVITLVKNFSGTHKPRLYQACGTEDFLYNDNKKFREVIADKGFEHVYEEGPGAHEWNFWDKYIERAIKFFVNEK